MADPVNTFFGATHYGFLGAGRFNPPTGAFVGLHNYGLAASLGDDAADTDLSNGSVGDGQESTGEALSWRGIVQGSCTGWTMETFFEDGDNRATFDNAAGFHALYPPHECIAPMPYGRVANARLLPHALRERFLGRQAGGLRCGRFGPAIP